jgi:hypothetical protein
MATTPQKQTPEIVIPKDLSACQTLVVELARMVEKQQGQITKLQSQYDKLQLEYNELLQRSFRKRSERYLANPYQMLLDFGETPEVGDAAAGLAEAKEELVQVEG